jgi:predicted esterase
MIEKKLAIQKTVRFFQIGQIEKARHLLIVLHGYGQLPSYFGKRFEKIMDDFLVVIPEGMHRFYINGSSGRVGSSWMTKEAREDDIEDNLNYLEQLTNAYLKNKSYEKIMLLGFSQGGATAARFYYSNRVRINHLILWASVFPPDLEINHEIIPASTENYFFLGTEDPYFSEIQQKNIVNHYNNMNYKSIQYTGNHSINIDELNKLLKNLI